MAETVTDAESGQITTGDPKSECDVCYSTPGRYPIIDRFGQQLYEIRCPECSGWGRGSPVANSQSNTEGVVP